MRTTRRFPCLVVGAMAGILVVLVALLWLDPRPAIASLWLTLTEDTEYAPGYTEDAFRAIAPGAPEFDVRVALGDPFEELDVEPYRAWLYADDAEARFDADGSLSRATSFTEFRFDLEGRLTGVAGGLHESLGGGEYRITVGAGVNSLGLDGARIDELVANGAEREDVELLFGQPLDRFEAHEVRWLHYSRSPGSRNHRIRAMGIDAEGAVTRKRAEPYWD